MTPRVTAAVAVRVLTQLRRDPRTVVMLLVLPGAVMALLWWMFRDVPGPGFQTLAPALLAMIPMLVMFLVTSVTTLRERTSGTLERLLAMPLGKGDFVLGYAVAFGLVAAVQALLCVVLCVGPLGLSVRGPVPLLGAVAVADAVLGAALGQFVSAFARTEFQAVQFMPVLLIPQLLLCGLFLPRSQLPGVLHALSNVMPLTYAVDAMQHITSGGTGRATTDLAIVVGFAALALALCTATLRRRTE